MTHLGASLPRPDARGKVTGETRYPADLIRPGMLRLAVIFARRPHARIVALDTAPALALPGVVPPIRVVAGGGAAGEQQLGAGDGGRAAQGRRREPSPDRIQRLQPVEELDVLRRGQRPCERLVKVVVGVDQPGDDPVTARVDEARSPSSNVSIRRALRINPLPVDDFVAAVGFAFEGSPWIARAAAAARPLPSLAALHAAMVAVVAGAPPERQAALIASSSSIGSARRRSSSIARSSR